MNQHPLLTLSLLLVLLLSHLKAAELCSSTSIACKPQPEYPTHFPFWMPDYQPTRCGYPGFELSCSRNSQTQLSLPYTTEPFIVEDISYTGQYMLLSDPNNCIPKRVMDLTLESTPYTSSPNTPLYGLAYTYTFVNCSGPPLRPEDLPVASSVITCMSGGNYTVVVTFKSHAERKMVKGRGCEVVKRVDNAGFWWKGRSMEYEVYPVDFSQVFLELSWHQPLCADCVSRGGSCGFAADSGLQVTCFNPAPPTDGLSTSSEWGLILGAGLPIGLGVFGLAVYMSFEFLTGRNQNYTNTRASPYVFRQQISLRLGLDDQTIESYPKTVLGESKRLPKQGDNTCPICLSEYEAKDTLRSIPECKHYFHADCIDAWLRMHTTCPLCRNSPQPSPTLASAMRATSHH